MSNRRGKKIVPMSEELLLERQFRLKNEILREVRTLFHQLKQDRGLTQSAIAQRVGMDPAEVSRVLNGQVNITLATLSDLLEGMEAELKIKAVPVDEIQIRPIERVAPEVTSTQWSKFTNALEEEITTRLLLVDCQTSFAGDIEPPLKEPLERVILSEGAHSWYFERSHPIKPFKVTGQSLGSPSNAKIEHQKEVV